MRLNRIILVGLMLALPISACAKNGGDSKSSSIFDEPSSYSNEQYSSSQLESSSFLSKDESSLISSDNEPVLSSSSKSIENSSGSSISQINMDNITDSYKETVRRFKKITGIELPYFENIETYTPSYIEENSSNLYFEVQREKSLNEELFQAYLDFFKGLFDEWNEDSPYYNSDFDLTRYTWTLVDCRMFSVEISKSCLAIDTWIGNESDLKEHSSYVNAKNQFKAYANIELPTIYCVRADTTYIDNFDETSESYIVSLIGGSNLNGETYQKFEDLFISTIGECDDNYPKEETILKISKWSRFGMSIILRYSLDNHQITIEAIDDIKDQSKNSYIAGITYFKEATGFDLPSDGSSSIGDYDIGSNSFNFDLPNKDKDYFDDYAKRLEDNNKDLEKSERDDGSIEFRNNNGNSVALTYDELNSNISVRSTFNNSYDSSFLFRLARYRINSLFKLDIPNYAYARLSSFKEEKKYRFINFTAYPIDEEYIPDNYLYLKLRGYMSTIKGYETYGDDSGYDDAGNKIYFINFFNNNNGATVSLTFNNGTKVTTAKFAYDGEIITYNEEKGLEIMEVMHGIPMPEYNDMGVFVYCSVTMSTPYTHFVISCEGENSSYISTLFERILGFFEDTIGVPNYYNQGWGRRWYEWILDDGKQLIIEPPRYDTIELKLYQYTYEFYEYEYDAAANIGDML